MKICVIGLTHLGTVSGICAAQHFKVDIYDPDLEKCVRAREGKLPILEEGLDKILLERRDQIEFSNNPKYCCHGSDILWACRDTPVSDKNEAEVYPVVDELNNVISFLRPDSLVLLSSQLPVGTHAKFSKAYPLLRFAVSPENLQLGKAVKCFCEAERVIVGCDQKDEKTKAQLTELFSPFCKEIIWMRPESAEMTKHALNCFLSMSIAFSNEIGRLCEKTGADVREVEKSLKSDVRIGPNARLQAGSAYEGSSLSREVSNVTRLGEEFKCSLNLIPAIQKSNDEHRNWTFNKVSGLFQGRLTLKAALLGLTFKPGTRTIARSGAIDLAKKLYADGFEIHAFDPSNPILTDGLEFIHMESSAEAAMYNSDVTIVGTPWPEFRGIDWGNATYGMRNRTIVDPNGFLSEQLKDLPVRYLSVGRG